MARPKTKPAEFDEDMTQKTETGVRAVDPEDEELDNVFADFPQNEACIELYRTTDKGGKPSFVEDIMPAEFSFGYVCRMYGGGKYIAKGKYKDGTVCKRSFEIEGDSFPIKRKVPAAEERQQITQPAAQPYERQEVVRDQSGQPDALATVMSMMKTLVMEMRSSEDQVLDKMMKYKALFGSSDRPQSPIQESIGLIKTGIELGSVSQGGEGGFPWMMALDKLQGPLTELVSTIKHAVTRQPIPLNPGVTVQPGSVQPQSQPAAAPAAAQPGDPQNMEMILLGAMKAMLPMLVTGAAQKAEEGFYADLMLDQIPRQYYTTAKTWLEKPDCLQLLNKMNPGVSYYQAWFETLRGLLLAALTEELAGDVGTVQPEPASNASTERTADL